MRLPEPLASSSLPSAHTASAAAFTTAAVLGCPQLRPLLVPLAGAVGYGRVRTRAHWPTDVLAGAAAGIAAGAAVHRQRARRTSRTEHDHGDGDQARVTCGLPVRISRLCDMPAADGTSSGANPASAGQPRQSP